MLTLSCGSSPTTTDYYLLISSGVIDLLMLFQCKDNLPIEVAIGDEVEMIMMHEIMNRIDRYYRHHHHSSPSVLLLTVVAREMGISKDNRLQPIDDHNDNRQ